MAARDDSSTPQSDKFNLETDIARLHKARGGLVERVEALEDAVTALQEDFTELEETIDGFDTRLDSAEGRLTSLESAFEAVDFDSFDTRITSLEGRMNSLEAAHGALEGLVASHATHLTSIYDRLANLDAIGLDHENRLDAIGA